MSRLHDAAWVAANQRRLGAELARLRRLLAARLPDAPAIEPAPDYGDEPGSATALAVLEQAFFLSPFERDVLLLCAGIELDTGLAALCAAAQGGRGRATFGLALAALEGPHWSALAPSGPLRRWHLVALDTEEGLTGAPLRIDERVLFFLLGVAGLDPRLEGVLRPVPVPAGLTARETEAASAAVASWPGRAGQPWPVVEIAGVAPGEARRLAAATAQAAGLALLALEAAEIPDGAEPRLTLARLCERELALGSATLLLDAGSGTERRVEAFAEEMAGPLLLARAEPVALPARRRVVLAPPPPGPAERAALWRQALGPGAEALDGAIEAASARFALGPAGVEAAASRLGGRADPAALWEACRVEARRPLDALAQRIAPVADWDDLVLPEQPRQTLHDILLHVRHTAAVHGRWGFAARQRMAGLAALFAGPSGTGKTMAAEVLARCLALDLYRIDLAQTVSKYIGETEKNLRRLFNVAEASGAILLFDEADALFGRRSEVKDSHDRYANIEVSYLLQRMEAYSGLAILTTNQRSALDQAFLRRLRFVVSFPFPDAALREAMWRRAFPPQTPTVGLDPARLAQLNIAGGNIRNIALAAAFLAIEQGAPVGMAHLRRAAAAEYAKLEKPLTSAELGGWP